MADNSSDSPSTMDTIREEISRLYTRLETIAKNIDDKRHEVTADMAQKIARELDKAREKAHHLKHAGEMRINEVEDRVRQSPLISLGIAFGAGWLLSCLFRHLR